MVPFTRLKGKVPTVKTIRKENPMAKSKVKELPPRDAMSRTGVRRITRTQNRFAMMRESEAAKITDAYECQVEDQFRE